HRHPGYVRGEQPRLQTTSHGQEEEEMVPGRPIMNGKSGCHTDITVAMRLTPAVKVSSRPDGVGCSFWERSDTCPVAPVDDIPSDITSGPRGPQNGSNQGVQSSPLGFFSSSFSFIQQSLNSSQRAETTAASPSQEPDTPNPHSASPAEHSVPQQSAPVQSPPSSATGSHADREELSSGGRFWRERVWDGGEVTSDLPDCDSLDIEIRSSLSVDSDNASASSVTSGYESATPASDHGWDSLVKKYEGVLQDCLQNNRTHTKIESMMLKLQRLQQRAVLDDDYDAAERFGKKLEELCRERGALKLGLPSRQPSVALFLERLRQAVHGALQRADCSQGRSAGERSDSLQGPLHRRDRLILQKRLVEEEIAELQQRLAELSDHRRRLEEQIQQEEQQVEAEELEGSVLRSCTVAQLRDVSRALQELVTSESRAQICVSPPPSTLRLQEQEQALNLSIKEATAKVVMSQRLGSSLRRKVSETETQLLALHEAKLAAISGNDFSSARELKAEMKVVYLERDRLEALAKRLHSLSSGSSQELVRMKEQRQQLRQELEQKEAQHGESVRPVRRT
uniref:DISC1 scaffold protein n=1 Tax=Mola mola TaxID=94237 RepID=A0A3Q3W531_MOLML